MVQFHLGENSISFSDDFDKLNALRGVIADGMSEFSIYDTMAQLISKHGRMPDVDEFASVFPLMINKLLYEVIVPEIVDFLVENEIYDCSEELFVRKYQENYFDFAKQPQFQNFISHYTDLTSEYMEKRTQKAYDRANRSRWMGGGFGIKGAIKGAAQAAVLNVATGAVRGIGDGISDFASTAAYKSKKNSLLSDDVFHEFDIALNNCIHGCIFACQIEYSAHKGILCSWSQRDSIEKASAIFNNVQARVTDIPRMLKLMSAAIEISPYNEEYYSFLYKLDGINRTEVLSLAEYLGYSLYADRIELMETELNALLERAQSPKQYADCSKEIIALGQKYNLLTSGDMVRATSEEDDAASFLIKGQNVAIHVEDICSFRLEKLNESSYIGISSSKMVYSKYLENPAIDMPSLFDHLNQALVIKPSSEGQLPSAQVRPKEMLQSDKIFCPYCGKKIQRNSNFCCFCGSKINYKK